MAKKLIDFAKLVGGKLTSTELNAATLASEPWTVEFKDDVFASFEEKLNSLTTLEEAKNNPEVFNHLKPKIEKQVEGELRKKHHAETLHGVEKELIPLAKEIGIDPEGKNWNEVVKEIKTKAGSLSGDVDARVEGLVAENGRLNKSLTSARNKNKEDRAAFDANLNGYKVDELLTREIENAVPLAEAYQEKVVKEGLLTKFKDIAKSKAKISLDNGVLKFNNPDNPDLELMNDKGQQADLLYLIGEDAQPYIKATGAPSPPKNTVTIQAAQETPTGSAADVIKRQRADWLASQGIG